MCCSRTREELTLASIDGDTERTYTGLREAVADPNTAVAVIGMLTRHLAITMVGRHGEERTRAMLQKVILDASEAAGGSDDGRMTPAQAFPIAVRAVRRVETGILAP